MEFFLKYAPIINLALILAIGMFVIMRVGDMMKAFQKTVDELRMELKAMKLALAHWEMFVDSRLTQLETVHHLHYPGELRSMMGDSGQD